MANGNKVLPEFSGSGQKQKQKNVEDFLLVSGIVSYLNWVFNGLSFEFFCLPVLQMTCGINIKYHNYL